MGVEGKGKQRRGRRKKGQGLLFTIDYFNLRVEREVRGGEKEKKKDSARSIEQSDKPGKKEIGREKRIDTAPSQDKKKGEVGEKKETRRTTAFAFMKAVDKRKKEKEGKKEIEK